MAKIMLVEDDKSLREIYSIRLVAEGYTIVSAGDGEEALSLAVQEKPDLIISDVMMPKISGFDMLDILRSTPETKDIKVIIMTALSNDEQRQRSEALGAAKHLVKSQCGIEDVVNAVHEVLGDAPNTNAQANIATLSATATPAGKAAAEITPVNQPVPDMTGIQTEATTVVKPQGSTIPAPDSSRAMPSNLETTPSVASAPSELPTPAMAPTPISNTPVAPVAPVVPEQAKEPTAEATPQNPVAPQAPQAPTNPQTPQNPAGGNPVNFNQAPVTTPVAMPTMQVAMAQPVAGANLPAQGVQQVAMQPTASQVTLQHTPQVSMQPGTALTPQQVLTMMGGVMGGMPQARPMAVLPQVPKAGGTLPMPGMVPSTTSGMTPMHQTPAQGVVTSQIQNGAVLQANVVTPQKQTTGGERVLQPIHDTRQDEMRAEMSKRFTELLNDEDPARPSIITSKNAGALANQRNTDMKVPTTTQMNELIPNAPNANATAQVVAQSTQAAPAQASQSATQFAPQAPAPAAQPNVQAPAPAPQPATTKPQIDPNLRISDFASIPAPVEEAPLEAIRPAFIDNLEEELAKEMAEGSMNARMARELKEDETTKVAEKRASELSKEMAAEEQPIEMPKSVANSQFQGPNISSPNISA